MDYLYDGSFEGFLTCVYAHYYKEKATGIYDKENYQSSILTNSCDMATDLEKSMLVYKAIEEKISNFDLRRVYRVFLSSVDSKENLMLDYIRFGFLKGKDVSNLHGNPIVYSVQQIEKKVTFEVHRLAGLVRFSVLEGNILYSPITPDHNILELLAGHFTDRFKNDPFIIHDTKRSLALIAKDGNWYISYFTEDNIPHIAAEEKDYRALWKMYFENIAIKERTNPRCQKNLMPVRYWKNLTEFKS